MDADLDTTLIEARQTSTMTPYTDSNTYYTSTRPPTTTLMTPLELTTTLSDDDVLALFRERFVVVNESQLGIKKHEELVQDLVENITSNDEMFPELTPIDIEPNSLLAQSEVEANSFFAKGEIKSLPDDSFFQEWFEVLLAESKPFFFINNFYLLQHFVLSFVPLVYHHL